MGDVTDDRITDAGERFARPLMAATPEELAEWKASFVDIPEPGIPDEEDDE